MSSRFLPYTSYQAQISHSLVQEQINLRTWSVWLANLIDWHNQLVWWLLHLLLPAYGLILLVYLGTNMNILTAPYWHNQFNNLWQPTHSRENLIYKLVQSLWVKKSHYLLEKPVTLLSSLYWLLLSVNWTGKKTLRDLSVPRGANPCR